MSQLVNPSITLTYLSNNTTSIISSEYIINGGFSFNYQLMKELTPSSNQVTFQLTKQCSQIDNILSDQCDILCVIKEDTTIIFTGYLSGGYNWKVTSTGEEALSITVEDIGTRLLSKRYSTSESFINDTVNNVINTVCSVAGITVSSSIPVVSTPIMSTISKNSTCKAILTDMLIEVGYVYYFTNLGELSIYKISPDSLTPVVTFNKDSLFAYNKTAITLTRTLKQYKEVSIDYDVYENRENVLIYQDISGQDDNHRYCNFTISAGKSYPDEDGTSSVISGTDLEQGKEIVYISNITPSIISSINITSSITTNSSTTLSVLLTNNTGVQALISKLQATGDIISVKSQDTIIAGDVVDSRESNSIYDKEAYYIHTESLVKSYANLIKEYYNYSSYSYTFYSKVQCNVGSIVRVTDDMFSGLDVLIRVIGKSYSDSSDVIKYTGVSIAAFNLSAETQYKSVETPSTVIRGQNGKGISSVTKWYALSTSSSTVTGTFSTTIPTLTSINKYLWCYDVTLYTDETSEQTSSVIIGVYGDKGDTGTVGIPSTSTNITVSSISIPVKIDGTVKANYNYNVCFNGYIGTNRSVATASITDLPTGITISNNISSTTSIDGSFIINVASNSTLGDNETGEIIVTITTNGISFVRIISWSKSIDSLAIQQEIQDQADDITSINNNITSLSTEVATKASQNNLNNLSNTVSNNTADITSNSEAIALKASQSDLTSLQSTVGINSLNITQNSSDITSLGTRVTTAEGIITTHSSSITQNATDVTVLTNRVTIAEGNITANTASIQVNANNITSKVAQTDFDTLSSTVTSHGTSITQNSTNITSLASRVTTNEKDISANETSITQNSNSISALGTRVTTAEGIITANTAAIEVNADNITSKVSQSDFNTLSNTVSSHGTSITQNSNDITSLASRVTTAEDTITSQSSSITQNNNSISSLVTRVTTAESNINTNSSNISSNSTSITQNATDITLRVLAVDSNDASITNAKLSIGSIDNGSYIKLNADEVIIDGTISASKLNVTDLMAQDLIVGNAIRSNNYITGTSGFSLNSNGTIESVNMLAINLKATNSTFNGSISNRFFNTREEGTVTNTITFNSKDRWGSTDLYNSLSINTNTIYSASGTYNSASISQLFKTTSSSAKNYYINNNTVIGNSTLTYTVISADHIYININAPIYKSGNYYGCSKIYLYINGTMIKYIDSAPYYEDITSAEGYRVLSYDYNASIGDVISLVLPSPPTNATLYDNGDLFIYQYFESGINLLLGSSWSNIPLNNFFNSSISLNCNSINWSSSNNINYAASTNFVGGVSSCVQSSLYKATGTIIIDGITYTVAYVAKTSTGMQIVDNNSTPHNFTSVNGSSQGYYNASGNYTIAATSGGIDVGTLLPLTTNTYNIGSASNIFSNGYFNYLNSTSITATSSISTNGSLSVGGSVTVGSTIKSTGTITGSLVYGAVFN